MNRRQALTAILGLTILVRVALASAAFAHTRDASLFWSADTATYIAPAASLARGAFEAFGEPEIRRTPGYPLLLLPGVLLGHVTAVTIGLQLLLAAATAWLVHQLALLLSGEPQIALGAAALYALEPLSLLLSLKLLSETLFTFLFLASLYAWLRHFGRPGWRVLLASAVGLAAAVYVRPTAYFLPLGVAAFLAVGPEWRVTRRTMASATVFLLVCASLIGAWQLRNRAAAGYGRFSGNEDVNLWLYSLAVEAGDRPNGFLEAKADSGGGPIGFWALHPEQLQWPMRDRLAYFRTRALATLSGKPLRALELQLAGSANAMFNPAARSVLGLFVAQPSPSTRGWLPLTVLLAGLLFGTYLLGALGLVVVARRGLFTALFLAALIGYFALLAGGPIGTSRYRQPVMPLACILAAIGCHALATAARSPERRLQRGLKEVIDRAAAVLCLLAGAPLLAAIAAGVAVTLGPPILFRQRRPGLRGQPFELLKFRTMREGAGSDAERLTTFGRLLRATSLDELPELWNVLRGEMSLVGPRPLLPQYLERYSAEQRRRHDVKPGLTGWAQIHGRNSLGWEDRFAHDVWYVDHWSLGLDLRILARTLWAVLGRRGIHAAGSATMPEFQGSPTGTAPAKERLV
jgi:lipopolysaccharide/colanic/teichoic acid biosynthesis glycosyltransferase